jgi:signal transduction histidine kinase
MNHRKSPLSLLESFTRVSVSYPLRVTLMYAFFGGLWIIGSDRLAAWLFPNPQLLLQINTYKGWLFIAVTASLFYLELNREYSRVERMNAELEQRVEARTDELRAAQEQLVQQEKLAVLGRLAGGVSQELRNPLGIINNSVYFLRMVQPDADEKIREYLDIIESEAHNADKIVNDLLDFSSNELVDRESIAVSELVSDALQHFPAPENVQVTLNLPENLPTIYVDPRQMTQVLGNLVLNACQAMAKGGKLTLSAKKKGKMMAIAVTDTGVGITPENMKKLFEPLFTTKPKGIGLGLAVSKKLVEANAGKIEVQSEPGKGSTFTVWLPCYSLPN